MSNPNPSRRPASWFGAPRLWIMLAAVAAVSVGALVSGHPRFELLGFWTGALSFLILAASGTYLAAKRIVGPATQDTGARDAVLCVAVILASLASPKAALQSVSFVAGAARGLFIETPILLSEDNPVDLTRQVLACWREAAACLANGATEESTAAAVASPIDAGPWIWFALVALAVLLLARAMRQAREDAEDGEARPRRGVISYQKWIALCVYAALLAPASYFAVGSLLYLDLDAPSSSLAAISEALDRTEREAMESLPGVELNTTALEQMVKERLPESTTRRLQLQAAIATGRASAAAISEGRRKYKNDALENANNLKSTATAGQFEDYRLLLNANYGRVINETRLEARPCLERLSQLHEALNQGAPQEVMATEGPASAGQPAPGAILPPAEQDQLWRREIDNAIGACNQPASFPEAPKPIELEDAAGSFPGLLYGWMAKSSQATVLIVGLVGFGLLGAAVRMMGSPDQLVSENGDVGLTDASGKVFVQGVGAAFTVFLMGQAGMDLLVIGGKPNAFGLLLFCFIGAVFAEEIWAAMRNLVKERTKRPPPGNAGDGADTTGGPAAP